MPSKDIHVSKCHGFLDKVAKEEKRLGSYMALMVGTVHILSIPARWEEGLGTHTSAGAGQLWLLRLWPETGVGYGSVLRVGSIIGPRYLVRYFVGSSIINGGFL
jgi:hypothetical protein